MSDYPKRPCCGAHVDSNDPCCTFREDELNAKMYAGWWAEATKERDEARREVARLRNICAVAKDALWNAQPFGTSPDERARRRAAIDHAVALLTALD